MFCFVYHVLLCCCLCSISKAFRILNISANPATPEGAYFLPFAEGFVGIYGDPSNYGRERVNEGAFETPSQELIFEGPSPRQACPGMVGPFSDGSYYCTAREYGYCDRRSGTCFCNTGYEGIDCSGCTATHFMPAPGSLCYPKKLCQQDCNGAGSCNFLDGTCNCLPHRTGQFCETLLCGVHDPLCLSCTESECLDCQPGYYLTGIKSKVCSTCYDFDPRCAGCTLQTGCTRCADPVLTSVRRSGYRKQDPRLPLEEDNREFSITLPFGTKSYEAFADAENFFVGTTPDHPLKAASVACVQGNRHDETWDCAKFPATHIVCGHLGVFRFLYPNYRVVEGRDRAIQMTVERSGGGYGNVSINYYVKHFTTNDSDLSATARYTTSQKLVFSAGVVQRKFWITIFDDTIVEEDEVFQVVLETPEGGGSIGAQFRTNVTIIDDDLHKIAAKLTKPLVSTFTAKAASPFSLKVQATAATGFNFTSGTERFFSVIENDMNIWANPGTPSGTQRNALRSVVSDVPNGDGTYTITSSGIREQGNYQLRMWHAFPGGLKGDYYIDAFMEKLSVERIDAVVNFTWGSGRLIPRGSNFISIRWSGVIGAITVTDQYSFMVDADDHARLWVDGDLLIDHYHLQATYLEPSRPKRLVAGQLYEVVLEYREIVGDAYARLMWASSSFPMQVIPMANLFSLYEIGNSPVIVTIESGETVASNSECTGDGLYGGVVLQRSDFTVCPRDLYGNMRDDGNLLYLSTALFSSTVQLIDDLGYDGKGSEKLTPVMAFNNQTFCFDFSYIPERAGRYRLKIIYTEYDKSSDTDIKYDVAGSPFTLTVVPTRTFGPYSKVFDLPNPLYMEAGGCMNFTLVARDMSWNLRLQGGDDFEVYMYQVNYFSNQPGLPVPPSGSAAPTPSPTHTPHAVPTSLPSVTTQTDFVTLDSLTSPPLETTQIVVRDGLVYDLENGNYTAELCPVIAGWYEVHILLNGRGVSNQPNTILSKTASFQDVSFGENTFLGQYVAGSPYFLVVSHTTASARTSNAVGPGLSRATVGIPAYFMVTVRDPWDNVMRTSYPSCSVGIVLNQSPTAQTNVWNFMNGSYYVEYTAVVSGMNLITVTVDGVQIPDSPFNAFFTDGKTDQDHSFAVGPGLQVGTTGVTQYFELFAFDFEGNRKSNSNDVFQFEVHGHNNVTAVMVPCPSPPITNHVICNPTDTQLGHYFGAFTPYTTGDIVTAVYLMDPVTQLPQEIMNSPFFARIFPSSPWAEASDISGTLYDNVAGVMAFVNIQLRDHWKNKLETGGGQLELVLLGVGVEWGTIEPWGTTPGLPNAYHYKGFYAGYPNVYGQWIDYGNGSYTAFYNATLAGQYVMRLSVAEAGLNATYFNNTNFGYLVDENFNLPGFAASRLGTPDNFRTDISWTGDLGGPPGVDGSRGSSSYFQKFESRMESNINFNLTMQPSQRTVKALTETAFPMEAKFREQYWSARWFGMITPEYAERYNFSVTMDDGSSLVMYVGGVGTMLNGSDPGQVVINATLSNVAQGLFVFSDTKPREFVLEYVHMDGPSFLKLQWESASTPLEVIPPKAFTHWRNISHFNTTIHPNQLCPHCSTAYGAALNNAVVNVMKSFVVYGRDVYGNLLQRGGDVPSMVAIGRDGVAFRGAVTDYGNSTYLVEYLVTVAGDYRMYVTIGCCPPHPNVGISTELEMSSGLLVQGAPFLLTVVPAPLNVSRTVAVGGGLMGGYAGEVLSFTTLFRDVYNNPTTVDLNTSDVWCAVQFVEVSSGTVVQTSWMSTAASAANLTTVYNMTKAGVYEMFVSVSTAPDAPPGFSPLQSFIKFSNFSKQNETFPIIAKSTEYMRTQIVGSPFSVIIFPHRIDPAYTICKGLGIRTAAANRAYSFDIQLYDEFNNEIQVGGGKFYIRLIGDANFGGAHPVVPSCTDLQNGAYHCSYTPQYSRHHQLVVKVLNSSYSHAGGLGLTGRYYTTASISAGASPLYTSIDQQLKFTWPNGFIIPAAPITGTGGGVPLIALGQAVRWDGFLVSPRSDSFMLATWATHMNVSIYVDAVLVYDSAAAVAEWFTMQQDSAYELYVEAVVSTEVFNTPASLSLIWSTTEQPWALVPGFYLFDSAEEIPLSPFPVSVI